MNRLADRAGDVPGRGDEEVVLGDRQRDAGDVGFLEPVGADQVRGDLAGDGNHGDGVHVGVGQRGDQVGRARSAGRHADAGAAGRLRVPGGGMAGPLLMPDQDVPDPLGVEQRVVRGQDRAAGDAEHDLDAHPLKRHHQGLSPGDLRLERGHRGRARRCGGGLRCGGLRWCGVL
jgi:hypothetical protein